MTPIHLCVSKEHIYKHGYYDACPFISLLIMMHVTSITFIVPYISCNLSRPLLQYPDI